MTPVAHYLDDSVICHDCFEYWEGRLTLSRDLGEQQALIHLLTKSDAVGWEALPDGFTCADCGTTVMP